MNPFQRQRQTQTAWHSVGLYSTYPDLGQDEDCSRIAPRCKAFAIPMTNDGLNPKQPTEADIDVPGDLKDQVLVFKYKGSMVAVDHQCPHSSFPLSQGSLFDIEDFGIILSAGITCPKHGWSFDLFSGRADRGNYRLKVWEVELRDHQGSSQQTSENIDKEVWVRRKQRIG
ncbi:hypothetical protein N7462_010984 [Penicillium macrosclerotiorum]|uniref:uncharacterized protein n=1 Tax=Penicillium macrosclerotiorum TaxID=303699 RepID=UPI0025471F52|nr:uncharacterized protein N7462_010984 [Penicillium macrosclerotiorum]KAJ5666575.1 hypothetical protein N7462_010984 [Penicillium macrosclerotiorum]